MRELKRLLKKAYGWWIIVAQAIGWFNTRLFLTLLFVVVITPTGLIMRLFGKDILDQKLNCGTSYWYEKKQHPVDLNYLLRQF